MKTLEPAAIVTSRRTVDTFEVTFIDKTGGETTLKVGADVATGLARLFAEAAQDAGSRPQATKMPATFAVGSGRHEAVVLVRVEEDAPYGLSAADASELGLALLEQSESVRERAPRTLQ